MKLRAFLIFLATVLVGVIGIPLVIWFASGFPDEGSHGLWMPVMFGLYIGLPGGILFGVVFGAISLAFPKREKVYDSKPHVESMTK